MNYSEYDAGGDQNLALQMQAQFDAKKLAERKAAQEAALHAVATSGMQGALGQSSPMSGYASAAMAQQQAAAMQANRPTPMGAGNREAPAALAQPTMGGGQSNQGVQSGFAPNPQANENARTMQAAQSQALGQSQPMATPTPQQAAAQSQREAMVRASQAPAIAAPQAPQAALGGGLGNSGVQQGLGAPTGQSMGESRERFARSAFDVARQIPPPATPRQGRGFGRPSFARPQSPMGGMGGPGRLR